MKKSVFGRVGKRYGKQLLAIMALIVFLVAMLFLLLIAQDRKSIDTELFLIEQQKHSYAESTLMESFDQITSVANYFASMVLQEVEFPLPTYAADWYNRINDRATTCLTLMNYIKGIDVENDTTEYHKGERGPEMPVDPAADPRFAVLGTLNDTGIAILKDESAEKLYFYKQPDEGDYADNRVVVSVDARYLGQSVTGITTDSEYRCVVDSTGSILLSDRAGYMKKNVFAQFGLENRPVEEGGTTVRIDGERYMLSVSQIDGMQLYFVTLARQDMFNTYYTTTTNRLILIGLVLLLAALALGFIIARWTYRPIRQLLQNLNSYFPQNFLDHSIDEIHYINQRFQEVYTDNLELSKAVDRDLMRLREQQAAALQAQISPHFIYNTLDAINWISLDLLGRHNPISLSVLNTAEVFKSCMDQSTMFDTLEREIDITRKYIEVLKLRYNNAFEVQWDVDETLLHCKVLKICMQPVVENMAFHGLSGCTGQGRMRIAIYRAEGETLRIDISDNGVGIEAHRLEELRKTINDVKTSPSNHIGLRNVNLRLKLLYSERYGLQLFSKEGEGTTCSLTMPIDFEEDA